MSISIKRKFSVENPNCPQIIVEFSDGQFWSCAKVEFASWSAIPCSFDDKTNRLKFKSTDWVGNRDLTGRTFEDLETRLWEFVNNLKKGSMDDWVNGEWVEDINGIYGEDV